METYQKLIHISEEDRGQLQKLQMKIYETQDLKNLFLLLLRQYDSNIQSKQYLQDLIITNHNYLLFLDNMAKIQEHPTESVMEHLKQ